MKHKDVIEYEGGHSKLIEDIGNLKYDALQVFLSDLALKIADDAQKDAGRGRLQLSQNLFDASIGLATASAHIEKAWKVCKPYM